MLKQQLIFTIVLASVWRYVTGLQRPPPRYSQQYMPQTSFTCRNKIVGSYYADPETDCQLFHVCVSVAGSIQDYRFLCPNDTAFDQESQTCADWYDVDCEAATLYYASDNFDLYRIGSGLESLHYDNIRSDFEPLDNLQRSESNDPIRSSIHSHGSNYNNVDTKKKESSKTKDNTFPRNKQQSSSSVKDSTRFVIQLDKKMSTRKISRKEVGNEHSTEFTTTASTSIQDQYRPESITTSSIRYQSSYIPRIHQPAPSIEPITKIETTLISISTSNVQNNTNNDYSNIIPKSNYRSGNYNQFETTTKSIDSTNAHKLDRPNLPLPPLSFGIHSLENLQRRNPDQINYDNIHSKSILLSSYSNHHKFGSKSENEYIASDSNNYLKERNISHHSNEGIRRTKSSTTAFPIYPNHNYNNGDNYNKNDIPVKNTTGQNMTKYITSVTKNPTNSIDISQNRGQSNIITTQTIHLVDLDSTKVSKKNVFSKIFRDHENRSKTYSNGKVPNEPGFSPSSVNYLAENIKSTTPLTRRIAAVTTYNPIYSNVNIYRSQTQSTKQKDKHDDQQSNKFSSTTEKNFESTSHLKVTNSKKNDYDYAYYDNGHIEYDNLELEHVNNDGDSVKIT